MIECRRSDRVMIVEMNRPPVNAMDLTFCRELTDVLRRLPSESTRAAVLTGGGHVFSAGVDLRAVVDRDNDYLAEFLPALSACFRAVYEFPQPLVAAVNGAAIAGGCILATACDLRLIAPSARIGLPESRIGVPLPSAAIEIMRSSVSPPALRRIVTVGQTWTGAAAVRVGLADREVAADELVTSAIAAAEEFTAIPAEVFRISKQQLRDSVVRQIEANESALESRVRQMWMSDENRRLVEDYVRERL